MGKNKGMRSVGREGGKGKWASREYEYKIAEAVDEARQSAYYRNHKQPKRPSYTYPMLETFAERRVFEDASFVRPSVNMFTIPKPIRVKITPNAKNAAMQYYIQRYNPLSSERTLQALCLEHIAKNLDDYEPEALQISVSSLTLENQELFNFLCSLYCASVKPNVHAAICGCLSTLHFPRTANDHIIDEAANRLLILSKTMWQHLDNWEDILDGYEVTNLDPRKDVSQLVFFMSQITLKGLENATSTFVNMKSLTLIQVNFRDGSDEKDWGAAAVGRTLSHLAAMTLTSGNYCFLKELHIVDCIWATEDFLRYFLDLQPPTDLSSKDVMVVNIHYLVDAPCELVRQELWSSAYYNRAKIILSFIKMNSN